jgi:hypothetical protein
MEASHQISATKSKVWIQELSGLHTRHARYDQAAAGFLKKKNHIGFELTAARSDAESKSLHETIWLWGLILFPK